MSNTIQNNFDQQKKDFIGQMNKDGARDKMKLILIIVANTLDPMIGKGCELDIVNAKKIFAALAKELHIKKLELIIEGKSYSNQNVLDAVDSLNPGFDDIVVFYYTGHGFRFEKEKKLKYPQLDLQSHPATNSEKDVEQNTQNLKEIYDKITTRQGRLNIVIGDCCNTDFKTKTMFSNKKIKMPVWEWPKDVNMKTCKKLFCQAKASILMAAADEDQLAITDEQLGSIFTLNFMHTLNDILRTAEFEAGTLPWNNLLKNTKVKTLNLSKTFDIGGGKPGNQNPIFEMLNNMPSYSVG